MVRPRHGLGAGRAAPLDEEADRSGHGAEVRPPTFGPDRATFRRRDGTMATNLDIAVSIEDDVEVRRLTVTNHGTRLREIDVTSYVEIVLGSAAGDLSHPAFGKLFLETEYLPTSTALLCHRRLRDPKERPLWAMHVVSLEGRSQGPVEWETDRLEFLGRGRDPSHACAMDGRALSGTTGNVLDPILSLRQRIRVAPGSAVRLCFSTGMASDRDTALALAHKYRDPASATRAFTLAFTQAQGLLRHLAISSDDARQFDRLASRLFFADASLSGDAETRAASVRESSPGELSEVIRISDARTGLTSRNMSIRSRSGPDSRSR